jgi:hypothetical protein
VSVATRRSASTMVVMPPPVVHPGPKLPKDLVPVVEKYPVVVPRIGFLLFTHQLERHWMSVTPSMARYFYSLSTGNRPISRDRVYAYARDMKAGKWYQGVGALAFGNTLELGFAQGHHTLLAIMFSGLTVDMAVDVGLTKEMIQKLDQGRSRTFSDVLAHEGVKNYRQMATLAKFMTYYDRNLPPTSTTLVTIDEGYDTLSKYPEIASAIELINGYEPIFRRAELAWILAIQSPFNSTKVLDFVNGVATGANLQEHDPRLVLRDRINAQMGGGLGKGRSLQLKKAALFFLVATAWNAFYDGKTIERLRIHSKIKQGKQVAFPGLRGLPPTAPAVYRKTK